MKRRYARLAAAAIAALGGWILAGPASAAPPTVTPSPGYDARLQEGRSRPTIYEPAAPVARRHVRRPHHHAH